MPVVRDGLGNSCVMGVGADVCDWFASLKDFLFQGMNDGDKRQGVNDKRMRGIGD
jgi:hypothetical protein